MGPWRTGGDMDSREVTPGHTPTSRREFGMSQRLLDSGLHPPPCLIASTAFLSFILPYIRLTYNFNAY